MTDLHESGDPKYTAQIDTVGWIFIAFAVAVTSHKYAAQSRRVVDYSSAAQSAHGP
jgi:hypothetical protein